MEIIVKNILDAIKKEFDNYKGLISFTLVGSFSNLNKKLEKFNDLDLVFIFKEITEKDIDKFNSIYKFVKDNFSTKDVGITYSLKIGPIKIKSNKKRIIMLHFLVYSEKGYLQYESNLTRFSFQNYKPFLGAPLKKVSNVKEIIIKDLFNDVDGIPAMKKWIEKRVIEYLEPTGKEIKIITYKPSDKEYLEIIFYSVLRLSSNMLRLKGKYFDIDKNMCNEFRDNFKIELNELPKKILFLKEKLRKGNKFSEKEIVKLRDLSLNFIRECEEIL